MGWVPETCLAIGGCLWSHYTITPPVLCGSVTTVTMTRLKDNCKLFRASVLFKKHQPLVITSNKKSRGSLFTDELWFKYFRFSINRSPEVYCWSHLSPCPGRCQCPPVQSWHCQEPRAHSARLPPLLSILNTASLWLRCPDTGHWGGERGPLLSSRDKWGSVNVNGPS